MAAFLFVQLAFPPSFGSSWESGDILVYAAVVVAPTIIAAVLSLLGRHWWAFPIGIWLTALGFLWQVEGEASALFGVSTVLTGLVLVGAPVVRLMMNRRSPDWDPKG